MPRLTINGHSITVDPGTTILDAARVAGIIIPAMCNLKGLPHFTSCMVCVVQEKNSSRLLPSCSALATDGMVVETDTNEARHVRTGSLSLLMSEHAGDCQAPCTTTCPAHMNIPLMIRQIAAGKPLEALTTVYDMIALPGVLGRICPAPCEKACRRGRIDAPLSICLLKRFSADDGAAGISPPAHVSPSTQHRVAIVGAGPAGLAAAFYLAQSGHACTIFDDHPHPGGQLRYGIPEYLLPSTVLDREIKHIHDLGVNFRMNTRVGSDIAFEDLKAGYDAIILTPGITSPDILATWKVEFTPRGIKVDGHTFRSSDEKIFAGGEVIQAGHMAVRAVAHGKSMAISIDQFLGGLTVTGPPNRFESRLGKIEAAEGQELMKEASPHVRISPIDGPGTGFTQDEAIRESKRCMHCDCRKAEACKLRDYMEAHMTGPMHVPAEGRKPVERNITHPRVIFESGKCIKCGICVRITTHAGEKPGLAFLGRGFDAMVGVPFGASLEAGLGHSADQCVKECPTGALAWKEL
ncbi:MAG: 2Fe-2S iron-sulfur cluster-binding protein [bacterium]